jgi:FkbM family methyltransferase
MYQKYIFTNDNNVEILLSDSLSYSPEFFAARNHHEVIFRKINTLLINLDIIEKNKNIIDLGCWIGDNSIPWAKNINGIVYAIDPSLLNCSFINEVAKINNINNIKTIQEAIADKKRMISTQYDISHCPFNLDDVGETKVETTSLDFLLEQKIIENIGYIHLDVEGFENLVLIGAENVIRSYNPIITFEQHLETDNVKENCDFLKQRGYTVYLIDETLPGCRPDCRNLLAIPQYKNPEEVKNIILENYNCLIEY